MTALFDRIKKEIPNGDQLVELDSFLHNSPLQEMVKLALDYGLGNKIKPVDSKINKFIINRFDVLNEFTIKSINSKFICYINGLLIEAYKTDLFNRIKKDISDIKREITNEKYDFCFASYKRNNALQEMLKDALEIGLGNRIKPDDISFIKHANYLLQRLEYWARDHMYCLREGAFPIKDLRFGNIIALSHEAHKLLDIKEKMQHQK